MKLKIIAILILCYSSASAQEFIPIWPEGKIPNSKGLNLRDSITSEYVYQVANPGIYAFFPSKKENKGAAVVICPGGGYTRLAVNISGFQLAKWFNTIGVNAFVLNYRLPVSPELIEREKGPLQDAQRAIHYIRANASQWGINPDKIGIQGSSAGGHLAASAGTILEDFSSIGDSLDKISYKPDFTLLVSPVIDLGAFAHIGSRDNLLGENASQALRNKYSLQLRVGPDTPPAFIVHAFNDKSVSVKNSLLFYNALLDKKVTSSLHVFPQGGHAIALRNNPGSTDYWTALCESWLIEMGFIPQKI